MPEMRDGTTVEDARLGRLKQRDERSRNFGVAPLALPADLRSKTWGVPGEKLNQGSEGACVGFGVTHELVAYPMSNLGLTNEFARDVYHEAQKIDPWDGEAYEGTSVLAGMKIGQRLGYYGEYRWAFSIDELAKAVAWEGPVVVGTDWLSDMDHVRESGRVIPGGSVRGGHCYVITGLTLSPRLEGEPSIPMFRCRNSWGVGWGRKGDFFIAVDDFEKHLMPGADMVIPVGRRKLPAPAEIPSAAAKGHSYRGGHSAVGLVDWKNVRGWRVA